VTRPDETLDLEGQRALASVLRGLGTRGDLALTIGRYEIGDVLGRGACGQVYAAHDPQLGRDVAIKIVLSPWERPDPSGEARLLREAAALARLQDPHVVPVYDVGLDDIGAGTGAPTRRGVYIVMARIHGRTLDTWQREDSPTPDAIVRAYVEAARGLAAAHAVGVVHRDFKPGNAMVNDEGRVVVLDFGLARALDEGPSVASEDRGSTVDIDTSQSFTATGTVLGTPRYMAPEQHGAEPATPAVDQFAWCVALWEALEGTPPFACKTLAELAVAKRRGELPAGRAIPAAVRAVLARGLRPDPRQRWPSMSALCEALTHRRARRRRRLAAGSLAALGIGAMAAWGAVELDDAHQRSLCRDEGIAIETVWNPARAAAIEQAFAATGLSYAVDTWARSQARVSTYAGAWSDARRGVCEAATLEHTMEPNLARAATACLDDHRAHLDALLEQLASPDTRAVNKAAVATASLPPVSACRTESSLRQWSDLPTDPAAREHIAALRGQLVGSLAALATGRYDDALLRAQGVLTAATEAGQVALAVEARLAAADAHDRLGRPDDARQMAEEAFFAADAADRDDLALRASTALVFFVGTLLARHDDALQWGRFAQIRADRSDADVLVVAAMLSNLGTLHRARGEVREALDHHERALQLYEQALGPEHPSVAGSLNNLANVQHDLGHYAEAVDLLQRALAIDVATLGPEHPAVASTLNNLGVMQHRRGEYDSALAYHTQALAIRREALGPDHPDVGVSFNNLGAAQRQLGLLDDAMASYSQSLQIRERTVGSNHPDVAVAVDNLALLHRARGEYALARTLHQRALTLREEGLGPDHPEVATSLLGLGRVLLDEADHAGALELFERARGISEAAFGPAHPNVATALEYLGDAHEAAGSPARAAALFDEALTIRQHAETAPTQLSALRFGLARTLWAAGTDRSRAVALASAAAEPLRGLGGQQATQFAEIEAWRAAHPAGQ
jgi:tetratricopeptide (TPR) repeat protein/predicted Ser/Thr protein kinase